jgi:hypothetical protein
MLHCECSICGFFLSSSPSSSPEFDSYGPGPCLMFNNQEYGGKPTKYRLVFGKYDPKLCMDQGTMTKTILFFQSIFTFCCGAGPGLFLISKS